MDIESYVLGASYTTQEIEKVNQTINQITSGIKSITPSGNQLNFTLADDSVISVTLTGLSSNDFSDLYKNKLDSLNSVVLNKFSYDGTQLLFDGQPIGNSSSIDLTEYIKINDADNKYELKDSTIVKDSNYVHTDNNYSNEEKIKLAGMNNFSGSYNDLIDKPSIPSIIGLATETYVDNKVESVSGGGNNINDNLTTSSTNTYSIDKLISLLSNKQNNIIISTTIPTDLSVNNFWLDISSNTSYKLLRSDGTDYIEIGSTSSNNNQFEIVSSLPTENVNTNKMYLLSSDNSINVYNGTTWNNYGGINAGGGLTPEQENQISNIQYKQNILDENLTTPIKQITPAINYLKSSLETAKSDILTKASADNIVNNSTFNSHVSNNNPHQTKISNLADVQINTLLDGQSIVYDATNSIFKNTTINGTTDEKVKLTAGSTSSDYLGNLIDNATIQITNNKIVAKTLDGLNVTLSELNYISGLNENIMTKFSNFANGGVQVYNGVFSSYANLLAFNFSTLTSGKTYLMYVSSDENHSNNGTTYMCNSTTNNSTQLPYYSGLSSATQRDLTVNKVSLTTEVKNILPQANMDLTGIAKTTDLNVYMKSSDYTGTGTTAVNVAKALQGMTSTISQVDNSVNLSHPHPNKLYLDKIGEDANGKPTYNGNPMGSSISSPDTMLMSIYDPNKDGSVLMSDKLSSELTANNGTIYYKNNSGTVGWFQPPITPPEISSIRQLEFQNLTTNVSQVQDFYPALTDIKSIVQIYESIAGIITTEVVADFTNTLVANKTDNMIITSDGLKIQDNFNYVLTTTDTTTYIVKETQMIDVNEFTSISSIINS